eukprot:3240246-Lingulodinium_polyedra.AAC.1
MPCQPAPADLLQCDNVSLERRNRETITGRPRADLPGDLGHLNRAGARPLGLLPGLALRAC